MKRRVEQINMYNNMQANTGLLAVENFDFPNDSFVEFEKRKCW